MAGYFYALCAVTALLCAVLQLRTYFVSRYRLLLWGGICFAGLAVNNALIVVDNILIPERDFFTLRLTVALLSILVMIYGLVFESD